MKHYSSFITILLLFVFVCCKEENSFGEMPTPNKTKSIVGIWNVQCASVGNFGSERYVFYFFPNGLFDNSFIKEDAPGYSFDIEQYYMKDDSLSFGKGQNDKFENVYLKELTDDSFVMEADVNGTHTVFRGMRKVEFDNTLTMENKRKIVGTWNITKNESFWAWTEGDTELLIINQNFTYVNNYEPDSNPYKGLYDIMGNYIKFYEPTGKDPIGNVYIIEKITDEIMVLLNEKDEERVYGTK